MLNNNIAKLLLSCFMLIVFSFTGLKSADKDYYQEVLAGVEDEDFDMLFGLCKDWQEVDPENPVPLYLMAYIYYLNYYPDEGWNILLRVWEIDSNTEQLIPFAERLLNDLPENPYAMMVLGEALSRSFRYEEAISLLEKASAILPASAMPHHVLGYIYFSTEDRDNAEKHFLAGIAADPYFLPNYMMLGKFYKWAGKRDAAEKIYIQGLKRSQKKKRTANFHLKLAWIYAEKGNYKKSIKMLEDGLKIKPNNPGLMLSLGDVYMESGDFDKAEEIFEGNFRFVEDRGELYSDALKARLQRIENERQDKDRSKIRYD